MPTPSGRKVAHFVSGCKFDEIRWDVLVPSTDKTKELQNIKDKTLFQSKKLIAINMYNLLAL